MTHPRYFVALVIAIAGCSDPESARRLDAEIEAVNERITQSQEERKPYSRGTPVHDLMSLRIAIYEQSLAMLVQRRSAAKWRTTLSYTVDGAPYAAPPDVVTRVAALQAQLKNAREGRESDLQLMRGSADSVRPHYVTSIATKTLQIAQLEYQISAHTNAYPPYYVPVHQPAKAATPPKMSEDPAGKPATAQ